MDVQLACDYIITKMEGAGTTLSVLKLLKLLYFSQQWHLTFYGHLLFEGRFQAWDQGPVSREIYDRFVGRRSLYSEVSAADVSRDFAVASLACENRNHLDHVLDAYAKCKDSALDEMIRYDEPWLEARRGFAERCENEINEDHMRRFCTLLYASISPEAIRNRRSYRRPAPDIPGSGWPAGVRTSPRRSPCLDELESNGGIVPIDLVPINDPFENWPLQRPPRSQLVKICLRGKCTNVQLIPVNGEPARCVIQVQLDHDIPQTYHPYDIEMFVPTEFATLLEAGLPVSITLEQNDS